MYKNMNSRNKLWRRELRTLKNIWAQQTADNVETREEGRREVHKSDREEDCSKNKGGKPERNTS